MPFDLGFLARSLQGTPAPAPSHGGGSDVLADVGLSKMRNKTSLGFLDQQRQQLEFSKQKEYFDQLSAEKNKRQAAIDAWLSAVRSGNRADIWVLGKRLKGMGVNVQMPDAFSATEVPGASEPGGAPSAEPERFFDADTGESRGLDEPPSPAKQKQLSELDAMGNKVVGQLGAAPPPAPGTGGDVIDLDPIAGAPPLDLGGPMTMSPFGPGGPSAMKMPAASWRVSDPVTGTDIEISPEQILADQEKEIDQSFLPLLKMPDLDPVAQRAYSIGHEYAKGQLGFMTPKEAVAAGMQAADKYMMHMYRQGMMTAAQLKAAKYKSGGGGAGGGGATEGFGGTALSKSEAKIANEISDNIRATTTAVQSQENYKNYEAGLTKADNAAGVLDQGTSLGERTAFRQLMTAVEQGRLSDKDAEWYQASGGVLSRMQQMWNYWAGGGKLSEPQIREIKSLISEARSVMAKRLQRIKEQGAAAADAEVDVYQVKDPEQRRRYRNIARQRLGLPAEKGSSGEGGGGATTGGNATTRRLIKQANK